MNNDVLRMKNKRIFFISAAAVCLVVALVLGMILRIFAYEQRYVFKQAERNEMHVKELAQEISLVIETETENGQVLERAENSAVTKLLYPLAEGNQRFYILASEDRLLFYQNEQLTANREGYTMNRLLEQFKINGGDGFEAFEVMLQTKGVGSVRFSISKNSGYYIGLAHTFDIDEKTYMCIYCLSENYILNIANTRQENILMTVVLALLGCVITAAIVFFVSHYVRLNRTIYENDLEIERKNYMIDQFGQKIYHVGGEDGQVRLKDEKTGIYTEEFLYNAITELQLKQEKKMLVVLFGFRGSKGYRENLTELFRQIEMQIGQKELLFRLKEEHLVLLASAENEKQVLEEIQLLNYILQEQFKENQLVVNSVYAVQKDGDNLYKTLELVIREYQKTFRTLK